MANDRFVSAVDSFALDSYYEAPSAGPFNPATPTSFGAFVLFYITGGYQDSGINASAPDDVFLWGNYDADNFAGWGFGIENAAGFPQLFVKLGDGNAETKSIVELANPFSSNSFIERLILLEFWQDETNFVVGVNGSAMTNVDDAFHPAAVAVAPSSLKARIGGKPDDSGDVAFYTGIVAAGYAHTKPVGGIGRLLGSHFQASRESLLGARIDAGNDIDWSHRYETASLGPGYAYQLSRSTRGAALQVAPAAPLSWPDVGNSGFNVQNVTAVTLTNPNDQDSVLPLFTSVKNPDWWVPQATTAWKPDPPL